MIDRAANDRAPREKRPLVERFADAIGRAVFRLWALASATTIVALLFGAVNAALLCIGAAVSAGATLLLIDAFERRLTNG